ncbi:MAG: hypothetical protein NTV63_04825 [Candidatus Woesearchaeota archaeon]|nr:hypothetical protein [Candidatus Woesearchaeota archaeon]
MNNRKTPFDEMSGIEKREKKEYSHTLEALIEESGHSVKRMLSMMIKAMAWNDLSGMYIHAFHEASEELEGVEYNERDLSDFITANSGIPMESDEECALGVYSGILLDLLTRRRRKEGKKSVVKIEGAGKEFHYLFYYAKNFDEVYISNIEGDKICSRMGSHSGSGNFIVLNNVNGNFIADTVGYSSGKVNMVVINNSRGIMAGNSIAERGSAGLIVLNSINAAGDIGCAIAKEGEAGTVILNNLNGDRIGDYCGSAKGKIGNIAYLSIKAKESVGEFVPDYESEIGKMIILDSHVKNRNVGAEFSGFGRSEIITEQENEKAERALEETGIKEIILLADEMGKFGAERYEEYAHKIYCSYKMAGGKYAF